MALAALAAIMASPVGSPDDVGVGRTPGADESFPEQWEYITSRDLFNAVCCSRRAGKTSGAVRRAIHLMATKPGARVHYVTLIRRNCRKYFWWPIQEELTRLGWEYEVNENDLILWAPNGSWLQALSCDDLHGVKAVKGDRSDLFMVDECQENLDEVLRALIDIAATPMLTDTGGMLDLLGTVPEVEPTFFSEALDSDGWRHFAWTMFDHDFPESRHIKRQRVEEIIEKRGLTWEHPIIQREYLGRRVKDPAKLAYEFVAARNSYDPGAIDFEAGPWRHAMGLDLGFQDRDAIVVVAWRKDDAARRLYVRHWWQQNHNDVDVLAAEVARVLGEYRCSALVGDHGGHGATKVLKTLEARFNVRFEVKPSDVMVSVGLVNDDLRTGRLLLPTGCELATDLGKVQRTVNQRTKRVEVNKKGYHSDLSEAMRYAHHAARHWASKAPKPEPTRDERRAMWETERARREADPWR